MDEQGSSQGRGLKAILRNRRGSKEPAIPEETETESLPRTSTDNVLSKIRSRIGSVEGEDKSSEDKLSKLLRGKRKDKTRRKAEEVGYDTPPRGRSIAGNEPVPTPAAGEDKSPDGNEDASSFLTSDSDREERIRPPLIDRNSHSGYLTASSPQIRAAAVDDNGGTRSRSSTIGSSQPLQSSATSTIGGTSALNGKVASQNDLPSSQVSAGSSSLSVDSEGSGKSSRSRGVSPGSKIKDALKPSRRSGTSPSTDKADRPSSPFGSFFGKDRSSPAAPKSPTNGTPGSPQSFAHRKNKSATLSLKSMPSIITTPETPPPVPGPFTTVTPPTPVDAEARNRTNESPSQSPTLNGNSQASMSHRRTRSDSTSNQPSKLSQSMAPPLTPTIEEIKTPGTKNSQSTGGFFTSMFSAAQNAANTITSIGNNNASRPRTATVQSAGSVQEKPEPTSEGADDSKTASVEPVKPLAITTIGSGELSLSHLGISTDPQSAVSGSPASIKDGLSNRSRSSTVVHRAEAAAREEDISAARAVSAAYSQHPEESVTPVVEDNSLPPTQSSVRPGSTYEGSILAERTPPTSVYEGESGGLFRSGSLRNKVEKARKRRHRNNSSTASLGGSIAGNNSAVMAGANASNPKMTGFAVATKKRNRDFHQLFRSVPEDDYLVEDYSCALQRDILLAGRIYISEGHICFSSNILGWVTTLVISFDEIVCVEKESTAVVFPNAIAIQTLHARHTFRSLINRDSTYDLMIQIWKISHPGLQLQSSENGVNVTGGTGSKTEKIDGPGEEPGSEESDGGEFYDEDDESGSGSDDGSETGTNPASVRDSLAPESPPKPPPRASNAGHIVGQATTPGPALNEAKAGERAQAVAVAASDFAGPATHAPTECSDMSTHYEKVLKDEVIPAPLGKIYSMVFGPASGGFMSRWLMDDQKCTDLQMEDTKALGEDNKTRSYSYIKPLGGSIGPRQTKCIITEQLDSYDLEKAISVTLTTQTPDVPSGNVFSTKTRYCFMWGSGNGTRMIMTCAIEWTGKSWLKGPIEKGANDGQIQYANDLFKALRSGVSSRSKSSPGGGGGGGKGKKSSRKKKSGDDAKSSSEKASSEEKKSSWGPLEPMRSILEPVGSIFGPMVNVYTMGVALLVLTVLYWRSSRAAAASAVGAIGPGRGAYVPAGSLSSAQRKAAYEELWRSEEAALWEWLEERVGGKDGVVVPGQGGWPGRADGNEDTSKAAKKARQQVLRGQGGGMSEREIRRAIEVTEGKLRVLKQAVGADGGQAEEL